MHQAHGNQVEVCEEYVEDEVVKIVFVSQQELKTFSTQEALKENGG